MKDTYWYKLLKHFDDKHYIQNGLTLPFIIGAKTLIDPNAKLDTIQELFNEIKNAGLFLKVIKCEYIGEYVFNLSSQDDFNEYGGFDNIVDVNQEFSSVENINEFADYLGQEYDNLISSGRYSRNRFGEWEQFSETDIGRIEEINKSMRFKEMSRNKNAVYYELYIQDEFIGQADGTVSEFGILTCVIKIFQEEHQGMGLGYKAFNKIFEELNQVTEIEEISGCWCQEEEFADYPDGMSTNLKIFKECYNSGMSDIESAFKTPTGKWAKKLGFDKVRNIKVSEHKVTAEFYK